MILTFSFFQFYCSFISILISKVFNIISTKSAHHSIGCFCWLFNINRAKPWHMSSQTPNLTTEKTLFFSKYCHDVAEFFADFMRYNFSDFHIK